MGGLQLFDTSSRNPQMKQARPARTCETGPGIPGRLYTPSIREPPMSDQTQALLAALRDVERRMILRTDREENLPSDLQEILAVVRKAIASATGGGA